MTAVRRSGAEVVASGRIPVDDAPRGRSTSSRRRRSSGPSREERSDTMPLSVASPGRRSSPARRRPSRTASRGARHGAGPSRTRSRTTAAGATPRPGAGRPAAPRRPPRSAQEARRAEGGRRATDAEFEVQKEKILQGEPRHGAEGQWLTTTFSATTSRPSARLAATTVIMPSAAEPLDPRVAETLNRERGQADAEGDHDVGRLLHEPDRTEHEHRGRRGGRQENRQLPRRDRRELCAVESMTALDALAEAVRVHMSDPDREEPTSWRPGTGAASGAGPPQRLP